MSNKCICPEFAGDTPTCPVHNVEIKETALTSLTADQRHLMHLILGRRRRQTRHLPEVRPPVPSQAESTEALSAFLADQLENGTDGWMHVERRGPGAVGETAFHGGGMDYDEEIVVSEPASGRQWTLYIVNDH